MNKSLPARTALAASALLLVACGAHQSASMHQGATVPLQPSEVHALPEAIASLPELQVFTVGETVLGGPVVALEAGPRDAQPLVLVHGLGDRGLVDFAPILPALAGRHRVLAIDLPGFGRSHHGDAEYRPALYASVVDEIARSRFGDTPFDLVGHSMGAAIALELAGTRPHRVRRVVLVDAAGILHRQAFVGTLMRGDDDIEGRVGLLAQTALGLTGTLIGAAASLEPSPDLVLRTGLLRRSLLGGDPSRIAAYGLISHDFGPAIAGVLAPVLLVWGERDRIASLRNAIVLRDRISTSRLEVLPDTGHVPMDEQPAQLVALIEAHLSSDAAPAHLRARAPRSQDATQSRDRLLESVADVTLRGDYGTVVIRSCRRVHIEDARIDSLVVERSDVSITGSIVGVPDTGVGLDARDAELLLTGGRIQGRVALRAEASRIDAAGLHLVGSASALDAPRPTRIVFSVSVLERAGVQELRHGVSIEHTGG